MKRIIDKEQLKAYWQLDKWYEKTIYVIGCIIVSFWTLALIIGIAMGIIEA